MEQKPVGPLLPGLLNLRNETEQTQQSAWPPDRDPEIHNDEIRKTTHVDGLTLDPHPDPLDVGGGSGPSKRILREA
jgi:hypothetical protein